MNGKTSVNFIIFGATGDLTYRKLMPALYNLYYRSKLSLKDNIISIGRKNYSKDEYIAIVKKWVLEFSSSNFDESKFSEFVSIINYHHMDFNNINEYECLSNVLSCDSSSHNLFYYAVAPQFFDIISQGILSIKANRNVKLIIEKPFGENLECAKQLNDNLVSCFGEDNIYRIDHYLGKEMVQNIDVTRFSNFLFKNSWNKDFIEKVEIIAYEKVGVETRASYYDKAGALKDMVQNHLMQILSLVAMEPHNNQDLKHVLSLLFILFFPCVQLDAVDTAFISLPVSHKHLTLSTCTTYRSKKHFIFRKC